MTVSQALIDAAVRSHRRGDLRQAEQHYVQLLHEAPTAEILNNLGIVKRGLGDTSGAVACYRRAIDLNPQSFEAHNNLGNVLWKQGDLHEALQHVQRALSLRAESATTLCTYGLILSELGREAEAVQALRGTVRLAPRFAEAHHSLGRALYALGQVSEAISAFETAIAHKPNFGAACVDLGNALTGIHGFEAAEQRYRQALTINPDDHVAADNLLMSLQYNPDFDVDALFGEHRVQAARLQHSVNVLTRHPQSRNPERRLRIGYLSPDFRKHSVAYFIEPILRHHNAQQVETICYSAVRNPDPITERIRGLVNQWRSINGMSDDHAAELIHRDRVDLLVDLAGRTSGNRLGVFARRPAPIQVSYLGYGNTTGLSTVDYWLSDNVADPVGEPRRHTEELVRLRHGILCYTPPREAPTCAPPPAAKNGFLTFGSFNRRVKTNPQVIRLWSEILRRLPTSRLVLKDSKYSSPEIRATAQVEFARNGVTADRVTFLPRSESMREHLAQYSQIDVALDPFPYGGSTTSCEALWMGVPVLTLSGNCYVGRMTASLLTRIGLHELITHSAEDYVRRAAALNTQIDRLGRLRRELRDLLAQSPVCDARSYTQELEAIYRVLWRRWCASTPNPGS